VQFLVDDPQFLGSDPTLPVGLTSEVRPKDGDHWVAAVGDVRMRRRAVELLARTGMPATSVVHPSVDLGAVRHLGNDVIVGAGAVLSVDVVVHDHVHVNVGVTVSHDVVLGEYVTLSPGVHVAGWVDIRQGAFLGTGTTVINGAPGHRLVIGEDAVIAAGACVLGPVERGAMYAGVPARRKH
jgi:sugar O-acyltransferase (sialic acid O-acetyltransferase NeuD family)